MKGSSHGKLDSLTGAVFLGHAYGQGDLGLLTGDDDLTGSVKVGDIHICGGCQITNPLLLRSDDRSHASLRCLAGLLHESGALINQSQTGLEIKGASGRMRGKFTKRESGGSIESKVRAPFLQDSQHGETMHIKSRLAD